MQFRRYLIGLAAALALSGCVGSGGPLGSTGEVTVITSGEMPAPTRSDLASSRRPYILGPFDKLKIDVFGIEDLTKEVQIDASGRLSFPLAGVMEASGLTPDELATEIEMRLRGRYVRDPQVTVNLEETVSQVVTVDGQVTEPGVYPVLGEMTLVRAIATAGGVGEFAKLEEVLIFREVDGQRILGVYDLSAIRRGNYPDPEVFANDLIVVGNSPSRRLYHDVIQAAPLLTTPLILLLQNN